MSRRTPRIVGTVLALMMVGSAAASESKTGYLLQSSEEDTVVFYSDKSTTENSFSLGKLYYLGKKVGDAQINQHVRNFHHTCGKATAEMVFERVVTMKSTVLVSADITPSRTVVVAEDPDLLKATRFMCGTHGVQEAPPLPAREKANDKMLSCTIEHGKAPMLWALNEPAGFVGSMPARFQPDSVEFVGYSGAVPEFHVLLNRYTGNYVLTRYDNGGTLSGSCVPLAGPKF